MVALKSVVSVIMNIQGGTIKMGKIQRIFVLYKFFKEKCQKIDEHFADRLNYAEQKNRGFMHKKINAIENEKFADKSNAH